MPRSKNVKENTEAISAADMKPAPPMNMLSALDLPTLHTVADYFGVEAEDTIEEQVLALAENGVTYALYAKEFNVPLPEDYVEEEEEELNDLDVEETPEDLGNSQPITVERGANLAPQQEYLIKMTRANPYFEVASVVNKGKVFRFTQEHPYAIMDPRTAQYVLERETGFRQAFPDELAEYYE